MTVEALQTQPKLRFPEFSGDWIKANIDWFLQKASWPVNVQPGQTYQEIGVRSHGKGIFHKVADIGETLGDKRVFWVVPNALVLNIVFAWEQAVALTSEAEAGFIASHRFPMYLPREDRADTRFARDFFLRPRGKWLLELASPGGAGRNKTLGQSNFAELPVSWPTQSEQKKIADFLGAVDERINLLQRRQAALVRYKAGVMQRLFDQTLRFTYDDGSSFPDWEEKRLGDVLTIGSGRDYKHLGQGEVPVYGTGGYMTSVNDWLYDGESVCIGRKGTINSPVLLNGKFWTVDTLFYTHKFVGVIPRFVLAIFQRINWLKYSEASGVPSLSKSTIERIEVKIPHLDEQRKIADALSALDDKIATVAAQVNQMQAFKNGLLDQMFI